MRPDSVMPVGLTLLGLWVPLLVGEVDEGHSEWDYILCITSEGLKTPSIVGVQYNAEIVDYSCMETYLYFATQSKTLTAVQTAWLASLYDKFRSQRSRADSGQLTIRERKEYRMLDTAERQLFHRAVLSFKNDMAKKYEALASLHVGVTSRSAHHGAGYLVWNRVFLGLFELALREYESDVTLPYWDSTLDSQLERPTQSLIWSPEYAGNGDGIVTTGPFANWDIEGRKLMRNIGESGRLMKPGDITRIMTGQLSISSITFPNAAFADNLELHSYGVRLWVGGDMALLQTSMNDPMYFLMNAHIDCVWQEFRDVQEQNGMNPEEDWPTKFSYYVSHFPNNRLGVVPGITNRGGLRDGYGNKVYRCVKPTCSPDLRSCGSTGALRCNRATQACEAVASKGPVDSSCRGSSGYQNSYCVSDSSSDCKESNWVYLPIEVVYIRPQEFSYPVKSFTAPSTRDTVDIYSPSRWSGGGYNDSLKLNKLYQAPQVEDCRCAAEDTGRVYSQSYGLNYNGTYREYAVVDRRLPISSAWLFVAVKNPRNSPELQTRSLIRLYDDCGRMCKALCRVKGSEDYDDCSGVVIVSTEEPRQYSTTMEHAFYVNWDYEAMTPFPKRKREVTFLKYFCDYTGASPWIIHRYIADPYKPRPPEPVDPTPPQFTTTTTTTPAPTTTTVTTTTTTEPTTTVLIKSEWCFNATQCFKDYEPTNCTRCEHHTFTLCWDHCGKYLHCNKGVWFVKDCAAGLLWDDRDFVKTCNYAFNVVCRPDGVCTGCSAPTPPPPPARPTRPRG